MKISKLLCAFAISALSVTNVMAQQTYEEMEQLTVNEQEIGRASGRERV